MTIPDKLHWPALPSTARLPINRCNLPAALLGSLSFQRHPQPLNIDGVHVLHAVLFKQLSGIPHAHVRARYFMDYMIVQFRLEHLEDAGYDKHAPADRGKANYLRVLRGWLFDPNGREAAILKAWVESRFGLIPRFHRRKISSPNTNAYRQFEQDRAHGLYNTNALEAQLDLLYSYCQHELHRNQPTTSHRRLYRGINRLAKKLEILATSEQGLPIVLLNNINAFSSNHERADEFGDTVITVNVPHAKVFYFSGLLPGVLEGEDEYIVIGGLYEIQLLPEELGS